MVQQERETNIGFGNVRLISLQKGEQDFELVSNGFCYESIVPPGEYMIVIKARGKKEINSQVTVREGAQHEEWKMEDDKSVFKVVQALNIGTGQPVKKAVVKLLNEHGQGID